ncbi:reverse transcriptase domain-containing protein [Tanacetum coccineum]
MHTRSSSNLIVESSTPPKRHNRRRSKQRVEPFSLEETSVVTIADQRTMAELLQAPTEGYRDAIVIPAILTKNFELKHGLLNLVTSKQFYGFEKEDPHAHICWFNNITSTIKYKDIPNSSIKLMLFLFSIEGAARIWLEKEPPHSILTWEDLVSKFINQFFPPSKTINLQDEITNFQQKFEKTFSEAWDRFKDLLRACPHHGFTELHQLDTFYNALNPTDQDSLNAAASVVSKVSANTSSLTTACPSEMATLTDAVNAMLRHVKTSSPETVKAIYESSIATYNQNKGYHPHGDPNYHANNQMGPPGFPPVQNNQNCFNQNHGYNQNRGNNFNQGNQNYQALPQVAPSNELSNYKKINDANMKAMQNKINNVTNELRNEMQASIKTSMSNQTNELKNTIASFFQMNTASSSGSGSLPSNTVANPRGNLKAITTRSGISYDGPPIPPPFSPLPKVVEREPEVTKDTVQPSTENIQPSVVQIQVPIDELVVSPKPIPFIPYPSRANKQKLHEKDDNLASKFVEIFRELHFELSFADALLHMPKFASMFKSLLNNKEKLFDLAKTPVNENCSAVILKKLPEKLGDPGKFLIPCDFPEIVECLALADLGASINLMPLSIWKKLSLPELTPTRMILELADRSTTSPSVDDEAITFKVGQTSRYSYNDAESVNRIDFINVSCEDYALEVLGFSDSSTSDNPTPSLDPILSTSFLSLTPFEGGDILLEEIKACLTNDSIPPGIDDADFDPEGNLLLLEKLFNDDPSSPLPPKELKFEKLKMIKSFIDDPPELELKDLPSHLKYAFLEGTDKLPVIISKELKDEEKATLLKVLKSHKRAIAWKISDIKGIDPSFCTHKILMEDDFKPAVQHQRRVNLKIHEVIKKEVIKLLDAGLIYPISDSSWVSPVHCVPKKGGMTLNDATCKDHLPFMDQMLERLAGNEYYCFLDGFYGYFQIPIDPQDQEKTNFTCPYGTFAYRRMPFGLCNAPSTFQRCMMAIFHDMIEETMKDFMDDFSVFGDSFSSCLSYLDKMLKRCVDTNLVLNWEKCHFMVKDGIVLGHKISKSGIEVDKAKIDVIAKLPHLTSVKGVRMYTDHLALTYLLAKQDAKPRLLWWILLLQEFDVIIHDKKGAENLVANHLSRLENPHQDDLEKKEITETFPLETLGMISFRSDSSTPWFVDIANYHARNFIVIEMSS